MKHAILFSHHCWFQHGLIGTKRDLQGFKFYQKLIHKMLFCIHTEFRGLKLQNDLCLDVLFTGFNIFPQVKIICFHLIKHVSLGFNIYQWHF